MRLRRAVLLLLAAAAVFAFSQLTSAIQEQGSSWRPQIRKDRRGATVAPELADFARDCLPNNHVSVPDAARTRRRVFIGIMSDSRQFMTLGQAALSTWIKDAPYSVYFFVGRPRYDDRSAPSIEELQGIYANVMEFDCEAKYPPRSQAFGLWSFAARHVDNFDWFLQIDSDTYVNVERLEALLSLLEESGSSDVLVGNQGFGRPGESQQLGLDGQPYCLGMGYVLSQSVLRKFGPHLNECLLDVRSNHSDSEISRCAMLHAGVTCQKSPVPIKQIYVAAKDGVVYPRQMAHNQQMMVSFPDPPTRTLFSSAMVHPIKTPQTFSHFHRLVSHYVRPVFSATTLVASEGVNNEELASAQRELDYSCVNNPSAQLHATFSYLPECPSPPATAPIDIENVPIFVLNLDGAEHRYERVKESFAAHGLTTTRFPALRGIAQHNMTAGEIGYLNSMRAVLTMALEKGLRRILVLDDDAVPHCNFRERLSKMLTGGPRCGAYQWSENQGGVFLLGASIWINGTYPKTALGGWNMIDQDMRNHSKSALSSCYNANNKTFGSFASLIHHSVYRPLLDLMQSHPTLRFDWLWNELGRLGHIVRVAYPYLVVQDVSYESQIDPSRRSQSDVTRRASIHRWPLEDFCVVDKSKSIRLVDLRPTVTNEAENESPPATEAKQTMEADAHSSGLTEAGSLSTTTAAVLARK